MSGDAGALGATSSLELMVHTATVKGAYHLSPAQDASPREAKWHLSSLPQSEHGRLPPSSFQTIELHASPKKAFRFLMNRILSWFSILSAIFELPRVSGQAVCIAEYI